MTDIQYLTDRVSLLEERVKVITQKQDNLSELIKTEFEHVLKLMKLQHQNVLDTITAVRIKDEKEHQEMTELLELIQMNTSGLS